MATSSPTNGVEPPTPLAPAPALRNRRNGGEEDKPNAFWRTVLQVGPAAALALLLILPQVLKEILDTFGQDLPPGLYAALAALTTALTLTAAILAKVMARPDVQAWLAKYLPLFAATKK